MLLIAWSFSPQKYSLIHPLRVRPPTRPLDFALDDIRLRQQRLDLRDNAALLGERQCNLFEHLGQPRREMGPGKKSWEASMMTRTVPPQQ